MGNVDSEAGREKALGAGSFYGAVEGKYEQCGAIFTNLRHTSPKKLPAHAHELAFFALLLEGEYGERYERQNRQFRPFTIHFGRQEFRMKMKSGLGEYGFSKWKFGRAGGSDWRIIPPRSI
jgi:hypothetical protein